MVQREPMKVLLLGLFTLGIYPIIWFWQTAQELTAKGQDIPNPIFMFIPILNLLFIWKYCEAVEKITNGAQTAIMSLVFFVIFCPYGMMAVQQKFNEVS